MNRIMLTLLTLAISAFSFSKINAQQTVTGFWEVKEVKVGDQIMTPVAKWTRINEDGTFQSGNGWLQNSEGTWSFDKKYDHFEAVDPNGLADEFGPFEVAFEAEKMTWRRMEEGMPVTVILEPIDKLPKSTADELIGLWDLISVEKDGTAILDTFDPDGKRSIFIRWDRVYSERDAQGRRTTGYWHIHGHKPEITLLSHQKDKDAQSWRVSFKNGQLILKGISDSNRNTMHTYQRMNQFPK